MLAKIRRRLASKHSFDKESSSYGGGGGDDDDNDDVHTFTPPTNYIKISQGKIQLVNQTKLLDNDTTTTTTTTNEAISKKDKDVLENRIYELEGALRRLQAKVDKNNEIGSPIFEKELREQLESMNRVIKSKERKQQQSCRDHKVLQLRFTQQEQLLQALQQENKALILRVRQYEHCLDDVMRKVVDAIVAEDNLREEVALLKSRVRDLEAQNAQLSGGSPAKGRDEGYCTMSSGQPQPSNGHLEDLPEEPEQWLLPAEPCSTEMEDWSMSQEELAVITLDDEREQNQHHEQHEQHGQHEQHNHSYHSNHRANHHNHHHHQNYVSKRYNGDNDWIWNSNDFLNSTLAEADSVSDGISQLLQQKIIYSEDEEVACTDFTNDFYKLVNIRSTSARSLYSCIEDDDTDDEDEDDDEDENSSRCSSKRHRNRLRSSSAANKRSNMPPSPTPSEAGRAQLTSCSSSESEERSLCLTDPRESLTIHLEEEIEHTEEMNESIESNAVKQWKAQEHEHGHDDDDNDIYIEIEEKTEQAAVDAKEVVHANTDSNAVTDADANFDANADDLHELDTEIMDKNQPKMNFYPIDEKQCIEEFIKTELRRPPHILVKSKSTIDEEEPSCILRNNQRREIESGVVRSGSVNCAIASKIITTKSHVRMSLENRPQNSWRKSNGWKRITSPVQSPVVSPKKETTCSNKPLPTRIPTCIVTGLPPTQVLNSAVGGAAARQQLPKQRKSKIPPPVPVRRSYAS